MNTLPTSLIVILSAAWIASPASAQTSGTSPAASPAAAASPAVASTPVAAPPPPGTAPSKADMEKMMAQMMELGKPGENHKLLADLAGTWSYKLKMWMDGDTTKKPDESTGTATRKAIFGGRYFTVDVTGKMEMPGPDGKKKPMEFKGMGIEGYDNVKKKFVSSWVDSMSTMIMVAEGTYDPATKTLTYNAECEMMPGMQTKMREVIKIVDNDHHNFEMYENRGQGEVKTMEIAYTRAGKAK